MNYFYILSILSFYGLTFIRLRPGQNWPEEHYRLRRVNFDPMHFYYAFMHNFMYTQINSNNPNQLFKKNAPFSLFSPLQRSFSPPAHPRFQFWFVLCGKIVCTHSFGGILHRFGQIGKNF